MAKANADRRPSELGIDHDLEIDHYNGHVTLRVDRRGVGAVCWIGFSPRTARLLARSLRRYAKYADVCGDSPRQGKIHTIRGFTLVELLVVVAVVALVLALVIAGIGGARNAARADVCRSNLRQFVLLSHLYAAANHDCLPWTYDQLDVRDSPLCHCPAAVLDPRPLSYAMPDRDVMGIVRPPDALRATDWRWRLAYDYARFHGYRNAAYFNGYAGKDFNP